MQIAVLSPVVFFLILIWSGFWFIGSALTGLLLLIGATVSCRAIFQRRKILVFYITGLMVIYLIWLFIVAYASKIPNTSMMTLPILAGLPITFLIATNLKNFNIVWEKLRIIFFTAGLVFAIWAIWQVLNKIGYGFATGPLLDRNAFAALMNLLWFPAVYLFIKSKSANRYYTAWLCGLGLFLISIALFATTSRAGIGIWLVLLPVFLVATRLFTKSKYLPLIILAISILAYSTSALLLKSNIADRNFKVGISKVEGELSQDAAVNARLLIWQSTLKIVNDYPLTGTGWGTFVSFYPKYRSKLENSTSGVTAHNDYLQLASEGGVIALLIISCIFLSLIPLFIKSLKLSSNEKGFESLALLLGVFAVSIHAVINFIFVFSFMNIMLGLYLARVSYLLVQPHALMISEVNIRPIIKTVSATLLIVLLAIPFVFHLLSQAFLTGPRHALNLINMINPQISAYHVANFISAIYPKEYIAQQTMLQTAEIYLKQNVNNNKISDDFKKQLIYETLDRFEAVRIRSANNPAMGVREAEFLIDNHQILGDEAYAKALQILHAGLKVDPSHAGSAITLARLKLKQGKQREATYVLEFAANHVRSRRDQQLVLVEKIRIRALPNMITELSNIEEELKSILSESETGKPHLVPTTLYEDIDKRLAKINMQLDLID
jgi:O-antigen ligase